MSARGSPINVAEFESYARTHLQKQVYDYYRSGANDEVTLAENVAAYNRLIIRPRFLVDVSAMDLTTTILGQPISSPICIAPTAMQRMAHVDGELASARAAAAVGTCFCLSSLSTTNLVEIGRAVPEGLKCTWSTNTLTELQAAHHAAHSDHTRDECLLHL
jgi:isopentenyl diphosphate isomerase/L-lactate dehydrogenase-like FMN-dependent dehydrogenase